MRRDGRKLRGGPPLNHGWKRRIGMTLPGAALVMCSCSAVPVTTAMVAADASPVAASPPPPVAPATSPVVSPAPSATPQAAPSAQATPSPSPAAVPAPAGLERDIARFAARAVGPVGVSALHLETGRRVGLLADQPFAMGSVYKLPIAMATLARIDRGEERLDRQIVLQPGDLRMGGYTTELHRKVGQAVTVQHLLELAITQSDNTALDLLLRDLGGPPAVMAWMRSAGLEGIRVDRSYAQTSADVNGFTLPAGQPWTLELFRRLRESVPAATRREALARFEADSRDSATPDAIVTLLARLQRGELLSPESSRLLIDTMRRTRTGDHRIRGRLPKGTVVADKTGTIARSLNDVGLITLPGGAGTVVIAVFIQQSDASGEVKERVIADIARTVYDAFVAPVADAVTAPADTPSRAPEGG